MTDNKNIPSLYEWAGGKEVFEKLTEVLYKKVFKDELLSEVFKNMSDEHVQHVAYFIVEVFGGLKLYSGVKKGAHAKMMEYHLGKKLTEVQRKRWFDLVLQSADEIGMHDDPEFRSSFVAYLEWGSRLALINSNASENSFDENSPMSQWGRGETKGPYLN